MNEREVNLKLKRLLADVDRYLARTQNGAGRELLKQYNIALNNIRKELQDIYSRYKNEIQEKTLKIDQLKSLREKISEEIVKLKVSDVTVVRQTIQNVFEGTYDKTTSAINSAIGTRLDFATLDKKAIEASVNNPYDKIKWPNRGKRNINNLIEATRTEVTQGILNGRTYAESSKILSDKIDIGKNKAIRILRTESGRAYSESRLTAFDNAKDAGVKLGIEVIHKWVHSGNPHEPRPWHLDMDGQAADEDGMFTFLDGPNAGKKTKGPRLSGLPDEDINCGCTDVVEVKI